MKIFLFRVFFWTSVNSNYHNSITEAFSPRFSKVSCRQIHSFYTIKIKYILITWVCSTLRGLSSHLCSSGSIIVASKEDYPLHTPINSHESLKHLNHYDTSCIHILGQFHCKSLIQLLWNLSRIFPFLSNEPLRATCQSTLNTIAIMWSRRP